MSVTEPLAPPGPNVTRRAALLVVVLALLQPLVGCASYRGVRLYHQGTRSLERGDTAAAIRELEAAAALVPQASEIQNHLGLAYLEDGRRAEAVRAFDRAVELDCSNAAARENLTAASAGRPERRASTHVLGEGGDDREQQDGR